MPIITVQITREGVTTHQKEEVIRGMTEVLTRVLDKSPALTHVVIQEVEMENWGVGGLPALEYRQRMVPTEN